VAENEVPSYLTIEGPSELIAAIPATEIDGTDFSEPSSVAGSGDILDSPMGGDEISVILHTITVAFSTGTAALTFSIKLVELIRKLKAAPVTVRNPKTGRSTTVDDSTEPSDLTKMLK